MMKFAMVFPTRIVHKKFSGCSRNSYSTRADCRPWRIRCRMRNRLSAKTPASIPESTKETRKQAARNNQISNSGPMLRKGLQRPNSKLQAPEKLQAPNSKPQSACARRGWSLEFDAFLELVAWCLELGV